MSTLVALPPVEPLPKLVARLEEILAEAKAGRIRAIALAAVGTERTVWTGILGEPSPYLLLGGLADVTFEILSNHVERP